MLNISLEFRKGVLFIRLSGCLTKDNYKNIDSLIEDFKYIVININGLIFIDIEGIKTLITYSKKINNRSGKLFICSRNKENSFLNKINYISNEKEAFELI